MTKLSVNPTANINDLPFAAVQSAACAHTLQLLLDLPDAAMDAPANRVHCREQPHR